MPFPSIITSFQYPTATNRLNNPSHSALENNQSSTIGQIEAVIGLSDGASVLGTIIGDLRSPNSPGGGHVQGAAFGGTGQTTFNKGDIFVAQSASVISKLAVGTNGQVLQVQSGQAVGIQWSNVVANKIQINTNSILGAQGAFSVATVLYAASIIGSTLGTNNGIKFTGLFRNFKSISDLTIVVNYGNNIVASTVSTFNSSVTGLSGKIQGYILGNGNASSQIGFVDFQAFKNQTDVTLGAGTPSYEMSTATGLGNSSINSEQNQNLIITGQAAGSGSSILAAAFIVEKIV